MEQITDQITEQAKQEKNLLENFLQNNLIYTAIAFIKKAAKQITFTFISRYNIAKEITLNTNEISLFDLMQDLKSFNLGLRYLIYLFEHKANILDTFEDRSKLKPTDTILSTLPTIETFADFRSNEKFKEIYNYSLEQSKIWLQFNYRNLNSFDAFIWNEKNEYINGDYYQCFDELKSKTFYIKILEASPFGFITANDAEDWLILSKAAKPTKYEADKLPLLLKAQLDKKQEDLKKGFKEDRDTITEKNKAIAEKREAKEAEEKKKQEAEAKKKEKETEASSILIELKKDIADKKALTTEADFTNFADRINKAELKKGSEDLKALTAYLKAAKEAAKKEAEAKKKEAEAKEAEAKKKEAEAKKKEAEEQAAKAEGTRLKIEAEAKALKAKEDKKAEAAKKEAEAKKKEAEAKKTAKANFKDQQATAKQYANTSKKKK